MCCFVFWSSHEGSIEKDDGSISFLKKGFLNSTSFAKGVCRMIAIRSVGAFKGANLRVFFRIFLIHRRRRFVWFSTHAWPSLSRSTVFFVCFSLYFSCTSNLCFFFFNLICGHDVPPSFLVVDQLLASLQLLFLLSLSPTFPWLIRTLIRSHIICAGPHHTRKS